MTDGIDSETTSIPTNPRTTRPVGYAFVDVSTPSEAERAINDLNGKTILDRKVSVQLARKPEPAAPAASAAVNNENAEGEEGGARRRQSTRGRGRGRGGRSGRAGRNAKKADGEEAVPAEGDAAAPLANTTNEAEVPEAAAPRPPRKQRGPPEDGVPSKTKIMVANLPYDLGEEKVRLSSSESL
jgi:RNA recognition motif-containing protein